MTLRLNLVTLIQAQVLFLVLVMAVILISTLLHLALDRTGGVDHMDADLAPVTYSSDDTIDIICEVAPAGRRSNWHTRNVDLHILKNA